MSAKTRVGTAYLWDANTIAEEAPLQASGEADWDKATNTHYEPDTFRPIAKETADGELFYIVNDHLGTPREMFSEDGKLVWAAQYRTWGAVHKIWQADNDNDIRGPYPPPIRGNLAFKYDTVEAQAAQTCPIRFQGQWEDAETGLYYNRFRYYDPLAAQYISPDPVGLLGGLRSNAYVKNPSTWIDPWGLQAGSTSSCCLDLLAQRYLKPGLHFRQGAAKDPGLDAFRAQLEKAGVKVEGMNLAIHDAKGMNIGEIDILTNNAAIQFKNGKPGVDKVIGQLRDKTIPYFSDDIVSISYINGAFKTDGVVHEIGKRGYLATNKMDVLIGALLGK